jgi:catechol 2,3-dioxygenase-like lactoylglutathione lyase family enzyme
MLIGAHVILYSRDVESDREFFRDVLKFPAVGAGSGWLLLKLPVAEAAFHPSENSDRHELYFMCDDLQNELKLLEQKNVHCGPVKQE